MTNLKYRIMQRTALTAGVLAISATAAFADQVFLDDVIVDGSLCVGLDCVNGESFGFDTIRIKENNLRINATDTSNSASFPSTDWTLFFNDSSNGGANKFTILDITANRAPFTIEGGSPNNALFVEDSGDIGFGTANPVVRMHQVTGNTPTFRLEQDGSSGFTAQTWDLAGNEANFFIRDVTNGSQLPFRIEPGADTDSLYIEDTNDVGIGTNAPTQSLHVRRTSGTASIHVQEASSTTAVRELFKMTNNGGSFLTMDNTDSSTTWFFTHEGAAPNRFIISDGVSDGPEMTLTADGDLTIPGQLFTAGSCSAGCDRVFDADYPLPTIDEQAVMMRTEKFLPNVGPTPEDGPFNITAMTGGMLNELEKAHLYIAQLNERVIELENRLAGQ